MLKIFYWYDKGDNYMISTNKIGGQDETNNTEFYGLSTDKKPEESVSVNIPNGSTFYEMDTKKIFMYDKENARWIEQ